METTPSRHPRNLFILPGGIAEVFTSHPGKYTIVFQQRKGLCKLALEAGVAIVPTYVFGATDFYHNLITADTWFARLCRHFHIALTLFWGPFHLPVPYYPKLTMCCADPIYVSKQEKPTEEQIDALHSQYLKALHETFDKYKAAAGYPDSILEVK